MNPATIWVSHSYFSLNPQTTPQPRAESEAAGCQPRLLSHEENSWAGLPGKSTSSRLHELVLRQLDLAIVRLTVSEDFSRQ